MPLQCKHCKTKFEINFRNKDEALKFQQSLGDHSTKYHPGLRQQYRHVDEKGIFIEDSLSVKIKGEQELMDKISELVN